MTIIQICLLLCIIYLLMRRDRKPVITMPSRLARKQIILDSCALIDGRIVELASSGFVTAELIVPQFILSELQRLADGSDAQKRERARFGLDIVERLQALPELTVTIERQAFNDVPAVDDKLVALAKRQKATLYTTDYNLSKIAAIEGVSVLNVNELAQQLRPTALPGEKKIIKILQKGNNRNQGVGYLDDGTMVVVENGGKLVGKTMEVEVSRMHQTVAGKMIFAQVVLPRSQPGTKSAEKSNAALRRFRRTRPA